jgi:hypothetical protein
MENYFNSYRERFPNKSVEDSLKATRNWVVGYIKKMFEGSIDVKTSEWIERALNNLRFSNHRNR